MIKSFEIRNFRCFEKIKISGFSRINLIGGKNNSGKTALLEAIYLNSVPSPDGITFLRRLRRDSSLFLKAYPKRAWDNLFFDQDKSQIIYIILKSESDQERTIWLLFDDSTEEFDELLSDSSKVYDDEDIVDLRTLLSRKNGDRATLRLGQSEAEDDISEDDEVFAMIAHSEGIFVEDFFTPDIAQIIFIPPSFTLSSRILAQEYDNAYLQGNGDKILQAIQSIDKSIVEAKTLSIGEPMLYLKREGENFLPIALFGEAINRVVDMFIRLVNNPGSILLVDEIENGIHHTSQRELWEMLFKLSLEFKIQIIATTHSLEMIEAFRDVGLEDGNEGVGAYLELAQNTRTGRASGVKHGLEVLDYALKRGEDIRGE